MKTRVWRVVLVLHDKPGYDKNGQSVPHLTRSDLLYDALASISSTHYGLSVKDVELKLVGHIQEPPFTRRPRKAHPLQLVPHKGRGKRKAVEG